MATLRSVESLSGLYGNLNIDENAIASKFDAATNEKYKAIKAADQRTFNQHLTGLGRQQNTDLATLRAQGAKAAIGTGFNNAMQSSNALLYMLGKQQSSSADLTALTQQERANEQAGAAELAQNRTLAMQTADVNKQQMASLAQQLYAAEVAKEAQVEAAQKAKEAQIAYAQAYLDAAKYAANQSLNASMYAANAAYAASGGSSSGAAASGYAATPAAASTPAKVAAASTPAKVATPTPAKVATPTPAAAAKTAAAKASYSTAMQQQAASTYKAPAPAKVSAPKVSTPVKTAGVTSVKTNTKVSGRATM